MIGLVIGIACGAAELFLLRRLIRFATGGNTPAVLGLLLCKMAVLALAFVPVILFFRAELLLCGIGIASALVGGSVIVYVVNVYVKGGNKS
jgi:hypothetical protein